LGFALFSAIFSGLAATCETAQDLQKFMWLAIVPLYTAMGFLPVMIKDPNSAWSIAATLFPLTSPYTMISRMGMARSVLADCALCDPAAAYHLGNTVVLLAALPRRYSDVWQARHAAGVAAVAALLLSGVLPFPICVQPFPDVKKGAYPMNPICRKRASFVHRVRPDSHKLLAFVVIIFVCLAPANAARCRRMKTGRASLFLKLFGKPPAPHNVAIIIDSTAAMGNLDPQCKSRHLDCVLPGIQTLLSKLPPCKARIKGCGRQKAATSLTRPTRSVCSPFQM